MMMTQLTDENGTLVTLRWGYWHLECLHDATVSETGNEDAPYFPDEYVFTREHTFIDERDGEIFSLKPGYTYRAWRD